MVATAWIMDFTLGLDIVELMYREDVVDAFMSNFDLCSAILKYVVGIL